MIDAIEHSEFDFTDIERHRKCGYIAQQLEKISDEFVTDVPQKDGSTVKQVNTFEMLSYTTKAIQELHDIIKKQQEEIDSLKLSTR